MTPRDPIPAASQEHARAGLRVAWLPGKTSGPARELAFPDGIVIRFPTEAEALADPDWPDVLVSGNPELALLEGARLKHVVIPYAGVGARLRTGALERPGLRVHNSHYNAKMVATQAVALLLATTNRVVALDAALRRGDWGDDTDESRIGVPVAGKVAVLFGYGAIGRALRGPLEALGMEVRAYRSRPDRASDIGQYGADELEDALAAADAAVFSLPLTDATRGLVGRRELEVLRPTSVLVNVGRGAVIDEEALYGSLLRREIFGAGLDVWYHYPEDRLTERAFPSRYPFQDLDNVVMTPHSSNDVRGWQLVAAKDVAVTLGAILTGEDRNLVDLSRGY